ncbi:MAG: hypothetical protein SPK49_00915 [Erysipelotrichaceae bacterium]|nr:hypothetical protein [Erysipelotrichaceae bacterium]
MYPNRDEEYDRMRHLALSVILDYNITIDDYPLDMDKLCKRMGINVVPYSAYAENSKLELLLKRSKDGFNVPGNTTQKATIYYNDKYGDYLTPARIAQTKGHELKHILEEDKDDNDDKLCDFFSKYLRCPLPILLYLGIVTRQELISKFGVSDEQAGYILTNVNRHKYKFGNKYYDYEVLLIKQILGSRIKIDKELIMSNGENTNGLFDELLVNYKL